AHRRYRDSCPTRRSPDLDRSPAGTLTAGNSTPLTDGASAVLLASEQWATERRLPVLAYITYAREAAVDFIAKEGLLMAPAYAVRSEEHTSELQSREKLVC